MVNMDNAGCVFDDQGMLHCDDGPDKICEDGGKK